MHSRTADYTQLATGSARSSFADAIRLNGNNTLENIIVLPPTTYNDAGILINNANNQIIGSQINDAASGSSKRFGIEDEGNNTIIRDSDIFGSEATINVSGSNLVILNSRLYGLTGYSDSPRGIFIEPSSSVSIQDSTIQVVGEASTLSDSYGVLNDGGAFQAKNTSISLTTTISQDIVYVLGNLNGGSMTISGGELSVTSANPSSNITGGSSSGITISGTTVCKINGGTVSCP
jgi:hypothetical protein